MNTKAVSIQLINVIAIATAIPTWAQPTPAENLDDSWNRVCAAPTPGSAFAARCDEIFNTGPGSGDRRSAAAIGSNLELNAAQHRVAADQRGSGQSEATNEEQEHKLWESEKLGVSFSLRGTELERDDNEFEAGFESDAITVQLMIDYRASDSTVWGLSLQRLEADTDYRNRNSQLDSEYYTLTAMFSYAPDPDWWIDVYAGYSIGDLDTERATNFDLFVPATNSTISIRGTARGSTDADQYAIGFSTGRAWFIKGAEYSIHLNADYLDFTADAYSETDQQGLAMAFDESESQSFTTTLGVRAAWPIAVKSGVLIPQIRVDYQYEFDDDATGSTARFVGDTANEEILIATSSPDRNSVVAALSLQWILPNAVSLYLEYERLFEHNFLDEESIALGIRAAF